MINRRAFSLVEVLVAVTIISIVVLLLTLSFRQFFLYKNRFSKYEKLYYSVLSLKDMVKAESIGDGFVKTGTINGFDYKLKVKKIRDSRSLVFNEFSGEYEPAGNLRVLLYKVTVEIDNKTFSFDAVRAFDVKVGREF